jgi:hypothetical protein
LERERVFVLGDILLETSVMIHFNSPSVKRYRLLVLLQFIKGKNCSSALSEARMAIIVNLKVLSTGNWQVGKKP